ncbi:MAG: topoisomerase [Thermoplasmata archaeon]|nr:topoisomerase [Thermoplasmata archaeon]NIS11787.1 topoisomerase [Thermoplasmata archaeon]NIS19672.1 topoisomerase [Thermoplasmata archaeon]NIT76851.1 topoisomerase [Thermoplasmata archaeon]NIU48783.1 topoisomerase [Thermoplasmata archaeon]
MSLSRDRERLECVEKVLDELREREPEVAIIVEGARDLASLEALGVPPPVLKLNRGQSLLNLCEELARSYGSFVVLTDWDRKGGQLAWHLERNFRGIGAKVDMDTRRRLKRCLPYQIHDIESLHGHVSRLRSVVQLDGRGP